MRVRFDNYTIELCEGVYEPAEDSFALIDALDILKPKARSFLDLGCGTGIVGIHAAKLYGYEVIFSDINPKAVRCAKRNAQLNGIEGDFVVGDLMDRLSRIDFVAFNPPYLPGYPEDLQDLARSGGEQGMREIRRFIRQLHKSSLGGLLLTTAFNPLEEVFKEVKRHGFSARLILRRIVGGEEYYVRHLFVDSAGINLNSLRKQRGV